MLLNGHKLTDLLYLQESRWIWKSTPRSVILFQTFYFLALWTPYSHTVLIFLVGKISKKRYHQQSGRSKRWNRCPLVVLHRNPLVCAPRICERDIFLLEQLMPTENKNTENVFSGSAVDSQNSGWAAVSLLRNSLFICIYWDALSCRREAKMFSCVYLSVKL